MQKLRPDCLVPIGEAQLLEGLRKELPAEFCTAATRPPASYRGNPFQVEVAIAFARPGEAEIDVDAASGRMRKKQPEGSDSAQHLIARKDEPVPLLRFANRVPLLYQQPSCAITKSVLQTNWRAYGLHQPKGVNGTRNFPTFGERKFPSLAGRAISLRGDQRLRFWAAVRGVSGSPGQ
ncbi:MAG: hypothetical protein ACR652_03940, partial [Methylocystis sp.]|uniref:hypothetical protein n=1 Tax=Methylocystis sp. TaxID=1911079 RepID=UPI003DA3611C